MEASKQETESQLAATFMELGYAVRADESRAEATPLDNRRFAALQHRLSKLQVLSVSMAKLYCIADIELEKIHGGNARGNLGFEPSCIAFTGTATRSHLANLHYILYRNSLMFVLH